MKPELTPEQLAQALGSLKRYAREELDFELSDLRAKFLLEYVLQEFGPMAYNRGVQDAEAYVRGRVEDLPGICFEDAMTYWAKRRPKG